MTFASRLKWAFLGGLGGSAALRYWQIRNQYSKSPCVAVLPFTGEIGSNYLQHGFWSTEVELEKAFSLSNLKAVCVVVNSPGGSAVQSDLIMHRIRALSRKNNIPVYSFVEDAALSGGYLIALSGDSIYANVNSQVGSIGAITEFFNVSQLLAQHGVHTETIASGDSKPGLFPFRPVTDAQLAAHQQNVCEVHENFVEVVKARRKGKLQASDNVLFQGSHWTGRRAAELGLIDGCASLHEVMEANYGDVRMVVLGSGSGLSHSLLGLIGGLI